MIHITRHISIALLVIGIASGAQATPPTPKAALAPKWIIKPIKVQPLDPDKDGKVGSNDNCPVVWNINQADTDKDGRGNVCDNCPLTANSDQLDTNSNTMGDVCDPDDDGDGWGDATDNCPLAFNEDQLDVDNDGQGNVCDHCQWNHLLTTEEIQTTDLNQNGQYDSCEFPQRLEHQDAGAISADGRHVAFWEKILVEGIPPGEWSLVVLDRITKKTSLASATMTGDLGKISAPYSNNYGVSLSADGRYVAFVAFDSNLVANDTNNTTDVFVRDLQEQTTTRVSVNSAGEQGNGSSGDGEVSLSADGRYVAFASSANNLVDGDTNGVGDVFVRDLQEQTTTRVSVNSAGEQGDDWSRNPALSADGKVVAFYYNGYNFDTKLGTYGVYVREWNAEPTITSAIGFGYEADGGLKTTLSADGRYVVFESQHKSSKCTSPIDTPPYGWLRDRLEETPVSLGAGKINPCSRSAQPSISADGRYVVFQSDDTKVAKESSWTDDIFVWNRSANAIAMASINAAGIKSVDVQAKDPLLSADGRFVVFKSSDQTLAPGKGALLTVNPLWTPPKP